jgi:Leucine-rich repeat (LRR) protein
MAAILEYLHQLRELSIANNEITFIGISERHQNLEVLNISANKIQSLREI